MPERPLLILPIPGEPDRRSKKSGRAGRTHYPSRDRQEERLSPKFSVLQRSFNEQRTILRTESTGLEPEKVIVLETVQSVENFIAAICKIEGLEWLGEVEEEDIPPDDDFFALNKKSERDDKTLKGRLFLVFSNQSALTQLFSLWEMWKRGETLPWGLRKWAGLFSQLRDVRLWGVQDRLVETGVLEDWRERVEHNEQQVPCEIELWFRGVPSKRSEASARVKAHVNAVQGETLHESTIPEIAYHSLLVRLPIAAAAHLLQEMGGDAALVQCEDIQFFLGTGQTAGIIFEDSCHEDQSEIEEETGRLKEPVVALFDGLPLQNHRRLAERLIIDDPDHFEELYQSSERQHGTAMASLILHGDLDAREQALNRKIYVRPILRPDPIDWRQPRRELVPENTLVLDLVYRAVRRLYEDDGGEPPVAPQICIINLSIGNSDRLFDSVMSPFARMLDWLAWKYNVLFIVSAGNHSHSVELDVPRGQIGSLTPEELQAKVLRAIAEDARHRRLLSPAEAVNALTVGAVHHDASLDSTIAADLHPYIDELLPSVINAQGMGFRRAIKPEILSPGGRVVMRESLQQSTNTICDIAAFSRQPGQSVAAPGQTPGDSSYACYTRGTSNAAAMTSRTASQLFDLMEDLRNEPGGDLIDTIPRAVWIKSLLVHGANWGSAGSVLTQVLRTPQNSRNFKEYITRLLGYGIIDPSSVSECTQNRVTALSAGKIKQDEAHLHNFPLPPSLSGKHGSRRLTVTLAWFTPINPFHQGWRQADIWFTPPLDPIGVSRQEADWRAVQRGTVQHEVLEGEQATAFVDGDNLIINVSCRCDAGVKFTDEIPYALAITLEVAPEIGIDIFEEINVRVQAARVRVAAAD